jgi:hypothetical protein
LAPRRLEGTEHVKMTKWWIETRPVCISSLCFSALILLLGGTHYLSLGFPRAILGAVALLGGIGCLICVDLSFRQKHQMMTRLRRELARITPEPPDGQNLA